MEKVRVCRKPTYNEILEALEGATEPLFLEQVYDRLTCEPDIINLEYKLWVMADQGMVKKGIEWIDNCPVNTWSL